MTKQAVSVDIRGLQQLQTANLQAIRAVRPDGALGDAVRGATIALHRVATIITHVDTGALRSSHRMEFRLLGGATGRIFIDPGAINPRGRRVAEYGEYEHDRGGSHAFYGQVAAAEGEGVLENGSHVILRAMPRGFSAGEAR